MSQVVWVPYNNIFLILLSYSLYHWCHSFHLCISYNHRLQCSHYLEQSYLLHQLRKVKKRFYYNLFLLINSSGRPKFLICNISLWRTSFNIFSRANLLMTISLRFVWESLYFSSISRGNFTGYQILGWCFILLSLNISFHCLLA